MTFEIMIAVGTGEFFGTRSGNWEPVPGVGSENEFATVEEAETAIESLREIDDDWAAGTYAVREIGQRYVL